MRTLRPPGSSTPLDRLLFGCVGRNSRAWRVSIRSYSTIRHRDAQMQLIAHSFAPARRLSRRRPKASIDGD